MNSLDLLIYLDGVLTKNLNSLVVNGYIEKRTSKWIEDRTLTGRAFNEVHNQFHIEDKYIKDKRDGYKGSNITNADSKTNWMEDSRMLEGKRYVRREEEIQRIYTSFELHQQLLEGMNNSNLIKDFSNNNLEDSNISEGDYVQITGEITSESLVSYIDLISSLLTNINPISFNSTLKSTNSNVINCEYILSQVNYIKNLLTNNNTQDMILKSYNNDVVVTVNTDNFFNSYANVYDKMNCNCKVVGKVVKVCNGDECIQLLRKTGQPRFYENFISNCDPVKDLFKSNGIILPDLPRCRVNSKSFLIIPVSICI